jgi:hypothetical protein
VKADLPPPSPGEKVLAFGLVLTAFGHSLYRVFRPSDPWPAETLWPRVAEAGLMGGLAVGALVWLMPSRRPA